MDKQQDGKGFDPLTITSNGRRYFAAEHKREVVERCLQPGASTAAVSLEYGFNANLVRKWVRRHQARQMAAGTALLPVSIVDAPPPVRRAAGKRPALQRGARSHRAHAGDLGGILEIHIGNATVKIGGGVDAGVLRTVLQALGHER